MYASQFFFFFLLLFLLTTHTHHQHQSQKPSDYLLTNTKTNILNNRNAWPSPEESAMEVELVTAELQKVETVRLVER